MRKTLLAFLISIILVAAACVSTDCDKQCNKPCGKQCSQSCEQCQCESSKATSTYVIATDTLFYRDGPQQARPADGQFDAGTAVDLIQQAGSYSLVRAADGREGYVSTDAVRKRSAD